MHSFFRDDELKSMTLEDALPFTKGLPVLKCKTEGWCGNVVHQEDYLFDLITDKEQEYNLATGPNKKEQKIQEMRDLMYRLMLENDAPPEYFERIGLSSCGIFKKQL